MSTARIGKIKLKSGGAEVRVLNRVTDSPNGENWRGLLVEHAKQIAAYEDPKSKLVGFFVIGFYSDGAHSSGLRWDKDKTTIPSRLLPAYVAEVIREEVITLPAVAKS